MAYLATTGTRTKDEKGTQGGDNDCVAIRVKAKKEILSHQQRAIQKVVLRATS